MEALKVFIPWLALGLFVSVITAAAEILHRIKAWAHERREILRMCQGGGRRYTFVNNRGY